MRLLYVFPHPDDECFGPGPAIASQVAAGHQVTLLTLTHGGATKVRHDLGLDVPTMGAIRAQELRAAAATLGIADCTILDLPDGHLDEVDPALVDAAVDAACDRQRPDVLVTYAVHGVSGHADHLVTHAVVTRVACRRRAENRRSPRRLALFTLDAHQAGADLHPSRSETIGCVLRPDDRAFATARAALACYTTYQSIIAKHRPLERLDGRVCFELFGERPATPLDDLTAGLAPLTSLPGSGSPPHQRAPTTAAASEVHDGAENLPHQRT